MTEDKLYMRRALELASLGAGAARPNPMVGAVVVHQGRIIGEGYHHAYGMPHAEVMAIRSVEDKSLLSESTIYVSLEPCAHYGKTPPCAVLLVEHRLRRVVVAMLDPFPKVSGRGVELLRNSGIQVEVGLCEAEAKQLNKAFILQHTEHRPLFALKWAQSADGYMDRLRLSSDEPAVVFSSAIRQREVHRERMRHQAILVGYRTALLDNPSLTNRLWYGANPVRLVLDPRLDLPDSLLLFTDKQAPTWVLYDPRLATAPESTDALRYIPLDYGLPLGQALAQCLGAEGIQSVLVEGGARTLEELIASGVVDTIEREVSTLCLGSGVPAPYI